MIITVSASLNIREELSYRADLPAELLQPGRRVVVPIKGRLTTAWISGTDTLYGGEVRPITGIIDDGYTPDSRFLRFARQVSQTCFISLGSVLDHSLPPRRRALNGLFVEWAGREVKILQISPADLEKLAAEKPLTFFYKEKEIPLPTQAPTPAAKTSALGGGRSLLIAAAAEREKVYAQRIAETLALGLSILIIVPDHLTACHWQDCFPQGEIYDAKMSPGQRERLWNDYRRGKIGLLIGQWLALLLPLPNLGAIIVDRAGSAFYQHDAYGRLNASQLAQWRSNVYGIPLLEGSPALTLDAYHKKESLTVDDRRRQEPPAIQVLPLKGGEKSIPETVIEAIRSHYQEQKKTAVILNKKGSSRYLYCPRCQAIAACPRCGAGWTIEQDASARCPRCGQVSSAARQCPECRSDYVPIRDMSIASLREAVSRFVPSSALAVLSADESGDPAAMLTAIEQSALVIATPILINPIARERFDAVIQIRPESLVRMDDALAAEAIFATAAELKELIRPGGSLTLFSTYHFHYSLKLIAQESAFFERELTYRRWFALPPFANVYRISIREKELRQLGNVGRRLFQDFRDVLQIRRVYLPDRRKFRGAFKAVLEAHTFPDKLEKSGILRQAKVAVEPLWIS